MRLPHTWCNVHEVKPVHQDDIPDENADVFAAVCALEESRIAHINRNLKGKFMTTETQTAIAAAYDKATTHTRHTFGDPMDIVGKHLPSAYADFYARVTNSLAWRMDSAVLNAARNVLFQLYSEDETSEATTAQEHFNSFCLDIADVLKRDRIFKEHEACVTLALLMRLRLDWHDEAQAAASAADRDYAPKSLSEMLVSEKPGKMRVETRANYEVLAKRMAKGDERKASLRMESLEQRDKLLAVQRVEDSRKLIPVIETIIDCAVRYVPEHADFSQLDIKTQRSMVDFTMSSMERIAEMDIARDKKVSTRLYGEILDAQDAALAELKQFRDTRLSEAGDHENTRSQASIDHERRQKAVASAT